MEEMPHDEFIAWTYYLSRYNPEGWREDLRTHYLLQVQGEKRPAHQIFPSLRTLRDRQEETRSAVDTLKGSKLFHMMQRAIGGDRLDLE
jgi:hypothetical protein